MRENRFASACLKQLCRRKERAYKYKHREEIKKLDTLIKTEISRLNHLYASTLLLNKNCRDLWNTLKKLSGGRTFPPLDVAVLNEQFCNSNPGSAATPLPSLTNVTSMFSVYEVRSILKRVKANKACGPDMLQGTVIRECFNELCEPLTDLFNHCLSSGRIPSSWKIARIVPVPKHDGKNLRPIACTSILLKAFERLLLLRLTPNMDTTDNLQFAFKTGLSTVDATAFTVHNIVSDLDERRGFVRRAWICGTWDPSTLTCKREYS